MERSDILTQVREWIDMVADEIMEECGTDTDEIVERVYESVDGSEWVIYYGKATDLVYSASSDECDEAWEFVQEICDFAGASYWRVQSLMAYSILKDRLIDELRTRGIEL